ncbi:unnamed protein product [Phytophthora lilii]|uniref:beta-glucosidase n=1 Tax=Phytophthora lilii TaxID=2077276 RepID=A0A9W6U086_9STRA|nr:unnamed protein product [Phytophthora lilii]
MLKKWLAAAACAALALSARTATNDLDARVEAIVGNLTVEILGQVTQISINYMINDYSLNEEMVRKFAKLHVGSFLLSPLTNGVNAVTGESGWNITQWRSAITTSQDIVMEENNELPMIYGLDSVHGAAHLWRITAQHTLAAGVSWVFAPILEISSNPLWPRTYETFGEDPHLVTVMGEALIRDQQVNNKTAACMKHFVAYSKVNHLNGLALFDCD